MFTFHTITDRDAYTAQRFAFIKTVEGSESWPYIDTEGIATIGVGFNLRIKKNRDEVFKILKIDPESGDLSEAGQAKELGYYNEIVKILTKSYPKKLTGDALAQANQNLQNALDNIMVRRASDPLITITNKDSVFGLSDSEMKSVFDLIMPTYQDKVDNWVINIPDSKERIVLESMAYNTKDGSRSLLGDKLADAIVNGNRAEAWFEIRYNSNGNAIPGIANRRYAESNLFSLYNTDPANVTEADAKEIMRMYTIHELQEEDPTKKLTGYESKYAPPSSIGKIAYAINDAKVFLISHYGNPSGDPYAYIDNVIVGAGLSSYAYKDGSANDGDLKGTSGNDLIFGESGNDHISGGAGQDVTLVRSSLFDSTYY